VAVALGLCFWAAQATVGQEEPAQEVGQKAATGPTEKAGETAKKGSDAPRKLPKPRPIAPFVQKGLEWLIKAQHEDGGWGGGSHANQKERDPSKVKTDPATTAFVGLALLRTGHSPTSGSYQENARRATEHLASVVEKSKDEGPLITDVQGTQPQSKLGRYVDTAMTAQFLGRVLSALPKSDPLYDRVDLALDKCLKKLQVSQAKDGSWNVAGGWAPVLQSSLSCSALEIAQAAGKKVDNKILEKARDYQKGNVDGKTGKAAAGAAAGVELYAFSGSQRANAADVRNANDLVAKAKAEGKVAKDAEVNEETLKQAGASQPQAQKLAAAQKQSEAQLKRLGDENLLKGFGNNGGEEYLSYLLTSESLVIAGGDDWNQWNDKMHGRLKKIQSADGSWTGHHCITSPVFCTAAVVQCLTSDHDAKILVAIADAAKEAQQTAAVEKKK
jgi:hypothetical protein